MLRIGPLGLPSAPKGRLERCLGRRFLVKSFTNKINALHSLHGKFSLGVLNIEDETLLL